MDTVNLDREINDALEIMQRQCNNKDNTTFGSISIIDRIISDERSLTNSAFERQIVQHNKQELGFPAEMVSSPKNPQLNIPQLTQPNYHYQQMTTTYTNDPCGNCFAAQQALLSSEKTLVYLRAEVFQLQLKIQQQIQAHQQLQQHVPQYVPQHVQQYVPQHVPQPGCFNSFTPSVSPTDDNHAQIITLELLKEPNASKTGLFTEEQHPDVKEESSPVVDNQLTNLEQENAQWIYQHPQHDLVENVYPPKHELPMEATQQQQVFLSPAEVLQHLQEYNYDSTYYDDYMLMV